MNMKRSRTRLFLVHLLPLIHLCVCLAIAITNADLGWQYMIVIDTPASVLVIALLYRFDHPLILFGLIGTLWWYLLSRALEMAWSRVFERVKQN